MNRSRRRGGFPGCDIRILRNLAPTGVGRAGVYLAVRQDVPALRAANQGAIK